MVDTHMVNALISRGSTLRAVQAEKKRNKDSLESRVKELTDALVDLDRNIDVYNRASTLLGTTTDATIREALSFVTSIINRALAVIFPNDPRVITIEQSMYRDVYPHFNVILKTGIDQKERSFKQSGSGLAQIISFLFTITLNDARKARPLLVIDELLNGLHPDAKMLIRDIIKATSERYQFIMVEYNLDMGKQYLMEKLGDVAEATHYTSNYYQDINAKHAVTESVSKVTVGEEG